MQCASSRDERGRALRELSGSPAPPALGRDEQEVELPVEVRPKHRLRFGARPSGVDALGAQPLRVELRDLVVHERDQGRHDQRRPAARDPGKLVAE
jgi:hypothetical protein